MKNNKENNQETQIEEEEETKSEPIFASKASEIVPTISKEQLDFEVPPEGSSEEESQEEEEDKSPKRKFLDINFSFLMFFIDIAIILGVGTFNSQKVYSVGSTIGNFNSTLYILLAVGVTILVNFLVYSGFKIVGGLLGGYSLVKIDALGFSFIFPSEKGKKTKVSFSFINIFDFHLLMAPKPGKKTNHFLYLLGGMVGYIILTTIIVVVALTAVPANDWLYYTLLYGLAYGFVVPLYQLFPCRLDYPNDCFTLIRTTKLDDREAYNAELTNVAHLLRNEDVVTKEFEDYSSYYKSHCLYFNYLNQLYSGDIDGAVWTLSEMQRLKIYFTDSLKAHFVSEKLYILLFSDSVEEADAAYSELPRYERRVFSNASDLCCFRSAILVATIIHNNLEDAKEVLQGYSKFLAFNKNDSSARFDKEKELFEMALAKAKAYAPDWDLSIPEVKAEEEGEDE